MATETIITKDMKEHIEKIQRDIENGNMTCPKCGKKMKNSYDEISKKISPYLWECECSPNIRINVG